MFFGYNEIIIKNHYFLNSSPSQVSAFVCKFSQSEVEKKHALLTLFPLHL